ncbi:hypothetical protein Nans01_41610 [Nocardiopsis ansamitocini]|uniref:Uncharacterized protein n=1 Tax=Nocardiopsis ansamitocini TaxID=1670832 RepID=A0A9W6P901_9ACTN|nr:hypothetical protein Nans01_41610 [Nocardiopsis ansamitocini]
MPVGAQEMVRRVIRADGQHRTVEVVHYVDRGVAHATRLVGLSETRKDLTLYRMRDTVRVSTVEEC